MLPSAAADSSAILKTLGSVTLKRLLKLSGRQDVTDVQVRDAIAIVAWLESGGSLLRSRRVLRELFKLLDKDLLQQLAESYSSKAYAKPYDNAILLAKSKESNLLQLLPSILDESILGSLRTLGVDYSTISAATAYASVCAHSLLPHQDEVVKKACDAIESGRQFLIQMPTGSGKTTTAIMTLIRSGILSSVFHEHKLAFWLAPTNELLDQAQEAFDKLWARFGDREAYYFNTNMHGAAAPMPYGSLVFTTYQTAANWDASGLAAHYGRDTAVVVADEAHRALAPSFQSALRALSANSLRFGLTATPGRSAEQTTENKRLAELFASRIVKTSESNNEIADLQSEGVLSRLQREVVQVAGVISKQSIPDLKGYPVDTDVMTLKENAATLDQLAADDNRNRLILDSVEAATNRGSRVVIFACNVYHSRLLCAALLLKGIPAASVDSDTSESSRRTVVREFRQGNLRALSNFAVFTTGFDAPGTDTVVIARPTTSIVTYSQMIGRALRGPRMGGSSSSTVVEFSDSVALAQNATEIYDHFRAYWSAE